MKNTFSLRCNECGGVLEYSEERPIAFCPYCGSRELIQESDNVAITRLNNTAYTKVELAKLAEKKAEREFRKQKEEKDEKQGLQLMFLILLLMAVLAFLLVQCTKATDAKKFKAGYINPPGWSEDFIGVNYKTVSGEFEDAGFTNIVVVPEDGVDKDFGYVTRVSIAGQADFPKGAWFARSDTVRITYSSTPPK